MTEDLYAILEIDERASADEIRRSYFRLAKLYHPDHQGESDTEATERFLAIQKAYRVLSDPDERIRYDAERGGPPPSPNSKKSSSGPATKADFQAQELDKKVVRDAQRGLAGAKELIAQGNYDRAVDVLKAVVRAVPDNTEFNATYGYAMALAGKKGLHRARDMCRRAVEAEPFRADFQAYLGFVYHKAGLDKTAEKCLAEALRLDPHHPEALRHLEEMKEAAKPGWRGLMKGLFGSKKPARA